MRVFVAQDMQNVTAEEVNKITQWVDKYELEDVVMVTSDDIEVSLGNKVPQVTAYNIPSYLSFDGPEQPGVRMSEAGPHPISFNKVAEFYFDDFPWPEGF